MIREFKIIDQLMEAKKVEKQEVKESVSPEDFVDRVFVTTGDLGLDGDNELGSDTYLYVADVDEEGNLEIEVLDDSGEVQGILVASPDDFQALIDSGKIEEVDAEDVEDEEEEDFEDMDGVEVVDDMDDEEEEEELDEALKKVIRNGKVVTIRVRRRRKKRLNPKQRAALRKAAKKAARSASAKRARKRAMALRKRLGLESMSFTDEETNYNERIDIEEAVELTGKFEEVLESFGLEVLAKNFEGRDGVFNLEAVLNNPPDKLVVVEMKELKEALQEALGASEVRIPDPEKILYNGTSAYVFNVLVEK